MQLKHLAPILLFVLFFTGTAKANVTDEDFVAQKTQNIINLCTASTDDPRHREAVHFCEGYLVGAYHYYQSVSGNNQDLKIVCFPEPKPTRNEAISLFISWAQKHPEYMNERPVETEFRFLSEKWPCKN